MSKQETEKKQQFQTPENVRAFILKIKATSLKAAISYLAHRSWDLQSSEKLRDTLLNLIQKKPQYLFLPVDYPNKKIRVLPKLIAQAFPDVTLIAYCESTSPRSLQALKDIGLEYILYPPISGTTIERIIARIARDQNDADNAEIDEDQNEKSESGPESENSGFKKKKQKKQSAGGSSQSAQQALQQFLQNDADSDSNSQDESEEDVSHEAIIEESLDSDWEVGPSEKAAQKKKKSTQNDLEAEEGFESDTVTFDPNSGKDQDNKNKLLHFEGSKGQQTNSGANFNVKTNSSQQGNPFDGTAGSQDGDFESNDPSDWQITGAGSKKSKVNFYNSLRDDANDTVFVKGIKEAVRESVRVTGDQEQVEKLKKVSNAICIVVESTRFNGYLIAASPNPDENFFDEVRKKLFFFLRQYGEEIRDEKAALGINLEEIEFEPWALEQAEFLKTAAHNGNEIAMAFFPTNATKTEISESHIEHMAAMKMDELQEDATVEFDLYIYMPENKKYILYTPQGRKFEKRQKERLVGKGLGEMHLRKDSIPQVTKYRAQNFINAKIQEYREKKKNQLSSG